MGLLHALEVHVGVHQFGHTGSHGFDQAFFQGVEFDANRLLDLLDDTFSFVCGEFGGVSDREGVG